MQGLLAGSVQGQGDATDRIVVLNQEVPAEGGQAEGEGAEGMRDGHVGASDICEPRTPVSL